MSLQLLKGINEYCEKYEVPPEYLLDVISDLKVIPMIRGKAFEFATSGVLSNILPKNTWTVKNLKLNAQPGHHDIDVQVIRNKDNKEIRVECKLAKNSSFSSRGNDVQFQVKCMRSRTFSDNASAVRMAREYGIGKPLFLLHADSYREQDFDFVITNLGNAFWETQDQIYTFNGGVEQHNILKQLFPMKFRKYSEFQKEAFNFMLVAQSKDLIVSTTSSLQCRKRKCIANGTHHNCGFIPNYPTVDLKKVADGTSPWKLVESCEPLFNSFPK